MGDVYKSPMGDIARPVQSAPMLACLPPLQVLDNAPCNPVKLHVPVQACMALRNMVARSPQLRAVVLEKGCERHLRAAKAGHPATCADVGTAALRDLGFDDYNA